VDSLWISLLISIIAMLSYTITTCACTYNMLCRCDLWWRDLLETAALQAERPLSGRHYISTSKAGCRVVIYYYYTCTVSFCYILKLLFSLFWKHGCQYLYRSNVILIILSHDYNIITSTPSPDLIQWKVIIQLLI